ncbi:hypothetical protein FYJ24_06940 [Actinomycetaceae bacterium WB03_NA08]|uniref:Uncharacterized protein n=1 Tax=Scrofimicrobium canadense TaxID=2652290 RepID=A0A6N7W7M7_9ACTO|nr:hypothetical protein [Scrofimicrobium canadense]
MTTPTPEQLDQATIRLIFALRDSLTDDGPSRIDFWSGGRAISALEAAAAGASTASEAITLAAKKLQIPQIDKRQAKTVAEVAELIDQDYPAWAAHITRNAVYILALADIQRIEQRDTAKTKTEPAVTIF